jgi:NAD(P)-dependent dehydrogenase (short-subunit alcohol dehydrogenase family)
MQLLKRLTCVAAASAASVVAVAAVVRSKRRIDWVDKSVLVTGGSRGLGLILARRLVAAGANVAIWARDQKELLDAQADLARLTRREVLVLPCDVDEPDQILAAVDQVVAGFGGLDAVFNVAGRIEVGPLENMTTADFEAAMKTNFWGAYHTTMAAVPHLKSRGGGRIVNIASIGGKIAVPHLLPYSVSKFALVGFSEGVRSELMPHKIYVTTVCPGLITTGSPRNADFKGQADLEYAWFSAADAVPGLAMKADRIADQILDAARHGDAELIRPMSASLQSKLHGVIPGVTRELLTVAARLLPRPGVGTRAFKGRGVAGREPAVTRSINKAAAERNNE